VLREKSDLMISRIALVSLLLTLLLATGIRLWDLDHKDDCAPFLAGVQKAPSSELIRSGTRTIAVPCNVWITRQPMRIQIASLLDLILAVLFLLNLISDTREWLQIRRRRGQTL
jgi:hypothetical protein